MEFYEPKPLLDPSIPTFITNLVETLPNYIIVKDGHIVHRALQSDYDRILVDTYDNVLPEHIPTAGS